MVIKAESILNYKGYKEVHSIAPANNEESQTIREKLGFKRGNNYTWFWKGQVSNKLDRYSH